MAFDQIWLTAIALDWPSPNSKARNGIMAMQMTECCCFEKLLSQTGVPCTPIDPGHSERERLEIRGICYYAFVSELVDDIYL